MNKVNLEVNVKSLAVVTLVSIGLALAGCTKTPESTDQATAIQYGKKTVEPRNPDSNSRAKQCEEKWGIRIETAGLTAAGYMVDFRFRVLDAAKAAPILERHVKPQLIAQATGAQLAVPAPAKIGQLRSGGNVKDGHVCFIIFSNQARQIRSGEKVTVVIGDFQSPDIVIQ